MDSSRKTVSREQMRQEWLEIQAAQKNPAQFRPVYDRYYEVIFKFIFRRTSDEAQTADLCSKVFLKALQRLGQYQFKGVPFSAWLYRIASNEVAQYFREVQKNRVISLEQENLQELANEIEEASDEQQQQALLQVMDQLRTEDMQLIEMRFFEQRPFKEIADILKITESNAKVKTYRILEKMKKLIVKKNL